MHNQTDPAAETAHNRRMASTILTPPQSLASSMYPCQREAGTRARFDTARLPVGASEATTVARQAVLERERDGGGLPAATVASTPPRKATHVTHEDAPVLPGISPLTIGTMPRSEDDEATRAASYEFHDRPGSGRYTADRLEHF